MQPTATSAPRALRAMRELSAPVRPTRGVCIHCAGPTASADDSFCCEGCRHVHGLLHGQGLARYYELRSGAGVAVLERPRAVGDDAWIELALAPGGDAASQLKLQLDVEGIHCTGCVWLIEEVFRRVGAAGQVIVNPALGSLELCVRRDFPLRQFHEQLLELGYRLGTHRKQTDRPSDDLVWRIGVCAAIAMNAMIFAIARYAGLEGGSLERVFLWLELGLALAAFGVGGIVFVRAAARGLIRGMVHLDLPIAVGLVLGYLGSFLAVLGGDAGGSYFDTLIVFTTLMLLGRFLRERVLEKNRAQLLDDAGIEGLYCRRLDEGRVHVVPVTEIAAGDRILAAPGDVLPVASTTIDAGTFSFDWVTGESDAHAFDPGQAIEAGAANAGRTAVQLLASEPFSASRLLRLLRAPRSAVGHGDRPSRFEGRIASLWVPGVLLAAAGGFLLHWLLGASPAAAMSVAVAVLVITCPCSFGIAAPIANELVLAGLRKRGLLVRSASFLERATTVRKVVFDKTGTLTSGQLRIADHSALAGLTGAELEILYNLTCRSSHPKSAAVKGAIPAACQRFDPALVVVELPGVGVEAMVAGAIYRLGAAGLSSAADIAFSRDDQPLAELRTVEELRTDSASEIAGLARDGLQIWMATGDVTSRALAVAATCGIPEARVRSAQSPEDKAAFIATIDTHDTLMIGDGVNDGPAVQKAHCSGTPAAGRAFLASRADFYLLTPGLGPVRKGLAAAHALRATLRRNLVWAVSYNGMALAVTYAGSMSPLLCALLMPASSIVSIALVTRALGSKGSIWTS